MLCITAKLTSPCPLRVISGHGALAGLCRLYPRKRTGIGAKRARMLGWRSISPAARTPTGLSSLAPPPLQRSHRHIAPRSVRDRAHHPTQACCACRWPPHDETRVSVARKGTQVDCPLRITHARAVARCTIAREQIGALLDLLRGEFRRALLS